MKKRETILMAIAAATILAAGCNKEGETTSIKATINSFTNDDKVFVDAGNFSCWQDGDAVNLNGATGTVGSITRGGRTGQIAFATEPTAPYYAIYPAEAVTAQPAGGTAQVKLPSMQKCIVKDGKQVVNALMGAQGVTNLDFYNLCALLKVVVPSNLLVTDIYVTTYNTDANGNQVSSGYKLWGNGTVTFNGTGARPTLSALTGDITSTGVMTGGDTVYLHIIDHTDDGVYYITVPQVENTNYKVWVNYKVVGTNQTYYYCATKKQSGNTNSLLANQIGYINFADIVPPPPSNPDPNDYIPGIYSISSTEKVNFAKGNLIFDVTTAGNNGHNYSWSFNTSQYGTVGYNVVMNGNHPESGNSEYCKMSVNNGVFPNNNGGYSGATFYDWGNYINQATETTDDDRWFTLSLAEWDYLLYTRGVSYARFAKAQVAGNNGLLLFPDEFLWPNNSAQPAALNDPSAAFTQRNFSAAEFGELEEAGCVFLRANGYYDHSGHAAPHNLNYGYYWTRDFDGNQTHSYLYFDNDVIHPRSQNAQIQAGNALCIRVVRRAD